MFRRLLAALAASAVLVAGVLPATALADSPTRHFQRIELGKIDPSFRPYMADASRQVTVVLQLSGDPAIAAAGLTKTQERVRARDLRSAQGKLDARIKSAGGRVTGRFQYAYNGIKVRTTGSRIAALAALPGVVAVRKLQTYTPDNTNAIPYIGAPSAWQGSDATGAGQTIAVIDTGIDYTHATFGGAGTPAAYDANNPTVIEAGSFPTAKVIAGTDFAGNAYNADDPASVPAPDADPLDCNSHGTHVSGSAAGQGVLANAAHSTFTGPYNSSTLADPSKFVVGPGVAPDAKLVALKVFGCEGSTNLVVDALEWVANYNVNHSDPIDVVNMSLGSSFGSNNDPDAVATNNLVDTGVVVVASAGNENAVPFITGAPAAATKAISVAALDAFPQIPGATVSLPGPISVPAINQNAYPTLPVSGTLAVIPSTVEAGPNADGAGGLSWGCSASDYGSVTGRIAVIRRGSCVFVQKGAAAQEAGAIGIIVINRTDVPSGELPTFLGYNPEEFTIPMIGTAWDSYPALLAADTKSATLSSAGSQPNPSYQQIASFSSSGPRYGDNALKPDLAAPGVNILSSLNGSGWNGTTYSGTSMAAPMTSGAAALVREAHPSWSPLKVKAALANTADASSAAILGYDPLRAGSGVIQANRAVATQVVATTSDQTASLSFGYEQIDGSYSETKTITISNSSSRDVWYTLTASSPLVSISPSRVKVDGRHSETVKVRASLSKAQVAALPFADSGMTSLSGVVVASPQTTRAGFYDLRVPYLLVPRGLSDVGADLSSASTHGGTLNANLKLSNDGVHVGFADIYALGITDPRGDGANGTDVRAAGVQVWDSGVPGDPVVQFAVNMWDRFSTAATNEYDIAIDTNGDGNPERYVTGIDSGLVTTGVSTGVFWSVVFDGDWNALAVYQANEPVNGSTVLLLALASDLGLATGNSSFTYSVAAGDLWRGGWDVTGSSAPFDVLAPAQSTGDFVEVAPKAHVSIPVSAATHAGVQGWMVVTLDDQNGAAQADIVRLPNRH